MREETVIIRGASIHTIRHGSGSPTVIILSGLDDDIRSWLPVGEKVAAFAQVFLYDRPGLGRSDPPITTRTCSDNADELHELLLKSGVNPPFILVGHSVGGMTARLFASKYPEQVKALILVESAHPDQFLRVSGILQRYIPLQNNVLEKFTEEFCAQLKPAGNNERMDIIASADQLRSVAFPDQIPVVAITAGRSEWEEDFPSDAAAELDQDWLYLQRDLLNLSHKSKHIIAKDSGHAVHESEPDLIVDAIRELTRSIM